MTPIDLFVICFSTFYGSAFLCMCCVACKNKYEEEGKIRRLKKLYTNIKYKKVNVMETIHEDEDTPLCESKIELGNYEQSQHVEVAFIPETIELGIRS